MVFLLLRSEKKHFIRRDKAKIREKFQTATRQRRWESEIWSFLRGAKNFGKDGILLANNGKCRENNRLKMISTKIITTVPVSLQKKKKKSVWRNAIHILRSVIKSPNFCIRTWKSRPLSKKKKGLVDQITKF